MIYLVFYLVGFAFYAASAVSLSKKYRYEGAVIVICAIICGTFWPIIFGYLVSDIIKKGRL